MVVLLTLTDDRMACVLGGGWVAEEQRAYGGKL